MMYIIAVALLVGLLYARYRLYKKKVGLLVGYRNRRVGGYLYYFRGRNEPFWMIKIGRATNPYQRLSSHRTANPFGVVVLGVKNDVKAEIAVHRMFANRRVSRSNEWFYLSLGLLLFIWATRDPKLTKLLDRKLKT